MTEVPCFENCAVPSSLGTGIEGDANGTACVVDAALNDSATCDVALVRSEQMGQPEDFAVRSSVLWLAQVQRWLRAMGSHVSVGGTTQYSCSAGSKTDATLTCTNVCRNARTD